MKAQKFIFISCIMLFFLFLIFSGCARASEKEEKTDQEDTFVIALPVFSYLEDETAKNKINKIMEKELGVKIDIKLIDFDHYEQNVKKMIANGEQVDILVNLCNMYVEGAVRGDLLELTDLLEKEGKGILSTIGKNLMATCTMNGGIYGIPNIRDHAVRTDTYYLNREILERNQINPKEIRSLEELETVFEKIHENEPDTIVVSSNLQTLCGNDYYLSANSSYPIGVLEDEGRGDLYMNLFESEEYRKRLEIVQRWHEKGYIQNELKSEKVVNKKGETFAFIRCGKPGGEEEMKRLTSKEYYELQLGEDVITQASYMIFTYGISKNTISAEKSIKILEILYQNRDINNILKKMIPEWVLPNLFLTDLDAECSENLWEEVKRFERNARKSNDIGFVFDPSSVMEEYLKVCKIYNRYRVLLENGIFEYEKLLRQMNQEMNDAGIDIVIQEKNRQYQLWKNSRQF